MAHSCYDARFNGKTWREWADFWDDRERASESRAAALEGALRALVAACDDFDPQNDASFMALITARGNADALLAESTPKEPHG